MIVIFRCTQHHALQPLFRTTSTYIIWLHLTTFSTYNTKTYCRTNYCQKKKRKTTKCAINYVICRKAISGARLCVHFYREHIVEGLLDANTCSATRTITTAIKHYTNYHKFSNKCLVIFFAQGNCHR